MAMTSKRMRAIREKVDTAKIYTALEAIELLKSLTTVKFSESLDVSVNLGIDPRKSDQLVRGAIVLPKGTGKTVRVAVFTQSANAQAARDAGADLVGLDDLAQQIKAGDMNFDMVIASPDAMRVVGQLGQILGPRGLMPNPKDGTVTTDIEKAIRSAKAGQVRFRADKNGIIHCKIGSLAFMPADLRENLRALLEALRKAKPSSSKGVYMKKLTLSSTMGPGLLVDFASLAE